MSMEKAASNRGGVILAVIAGAVSGAVLATITTLMLQDRTAPANLEADPAARPSPELVELRASIDDLRQQIARLVQLEPVAVDATSPASASALGPGAPATQAQVASINEALQQIEKRLDAALPAVISGPPQQEKMKALEPWSQTDRAPPRESWFLWTDAQVLEAYGPPSGANTNAGVPYWTYDFEGGGYVEFFFSGGRVVKTYVERPPKPR